MANLIEIGKSGIKVPFLGMGTWAIGGGSWWGDNDDELSVKTIQSNGSIQRQFMDYITVKMWWEKQSKEKESRLYYPQSVHWSGDMKHQSFIKKSMERKSIVTFQRKVSLRI